MTAIPKLDVFSDGTNGYIAWKYEHIVIVRLSKLYESLSSSTWKEIVILPDNFRPKATADALFINNAANSPDKVAVQVRIYSSGSVLCFLWANTTISLLGSICYIAKY